MPASHGLSSNLMGSGPTQFNLEAVRQRASELRVSLTEVLHVLRVAPERLQWDSIIKQYAALNLQLMSLKETLRGVLRQAVVHPCRVDGADVSRVLPIQLSTAVLPDQAEHERLLAAAEERRLTASGAPRESWYEVMDMQLDDFNRMIDSITATLLDVQGEGRQALSARSASIARSCAAVRQGVLPAAGMAVTGSRRSRAAPEGSVSSLDPTLRQLLTGQVPAKPTLTVR